MFLGKYENILLLKLIFFLKKLFALTINKKSVVKKLH